jgi:hypothetical protein
MVAMGRLRFCGNPKVEGTLPERTCGSAPARAFGQDALNLRRQNTASEVFVWQIERYQNRKNNA